MSKVFTITEGLENMGAVRSGGQGSVYKGRRTGEIITAIKLLPTPIFNPSEEDKHYRDFINEVKKLQRVNETHNPNIVRILNYGISETGGFPFIEMEYIDGPDLAELLKPSHSPVFTIKEAIKVADHLSNALAHCHKLDVKHGDTKSNNVKFNESTGNYVLLDFGLAMLSDEERRTSMRHAGAIEFMAPEQNEGRMLFETDVYSFGIILYELLAGKVPFPLDGNTETARNKVMVAHMETVPPDILSLRSAALPQDWSEEKKTLERQVPEWLLNVVNKCLQKKPEDRYATAVELHDYISHHSVYTAEVANIVHREDDKWQAALNEKETELRQLKVQLAQQEKERNFLHAPINRSGKRTVSKSAFTALLVVLLLATAAAVYGLFLKKSLVGAVQDNHATSVADSLANTPGNKEQKNAESSGAAKVKKKATPQKKTLPDSAAVPLLNPAESQQAATGKSPAEEKDETPSLIPGTKDEENNAAVKEEDGEDGTVRYKVRSKAYFHNEPDASTKREAFIVHWNNAILKPLDDNNGFIYVVFTNHLGQTSKGWLSKSDLIAVK